MYLQQRKSGYRSQMLSRLIGSFQTCWVPLMVNILLCDPLLIAAHIAIIINTPIRWFSLPLLAPITSASRLIWGLMGESTMVVWNEFRISSAIEDKSLSLPSPWCLPLGQKEVPFVFLGDDAFALKIQMLKPYPEKNLTVDRIYNCRRREWRISEILFGILVNHWWVFLTTISLSSKSIGNIGLVALSMELLMQEFLEEHL